MLHPWKASEGGEPVEGGSGVLCGGWFARRLHRARDLRARHGGGYLRPIAYIGRAAKEYANSARHVSGLR